jgi:hypothetical protein
MLSDIIDRIETDYLKMMMKYLDSGDMAVDTARASAKSFLGLLPFKSEEDIEEKLNTYCNYWPQFAQLRLSVKAAEDEVHSNRTIQRMRQLLKQGDVDAALALATNNTA